ncbi:hypothetical protein WN51_03484 [Melipona quadrifasciata]|uniref:Uncharacterized protein n=1 Tax=Melipona quadrifasciata TaxID=166423 RepID=A0A0M8ZU74_9HYME|nr:hypothetical protein WN51_03484 [Melipona quadrifasciata]
MIGLLSQARDTNVTPFQEFYNKKSYSRRSREFNRSLLSGDSYPHSNPRLITKEDFEASQSVVTVKHQDNNQKVELVKAVLTNQNSGTVFIKEVTRNYRKSQIVKQIINHRSSEIHHSSSNPKGCTQRYTIDTSRRLRYSTVPKNHVNAIKNLSKSVLKKNTDMIDDESSDEKSRESMLEISVLSIPESVFFGIVLLLMETKSFGYRYSLATVSAQLSIYTKQACQIRDFRQPSPMDSLENLQGLHKSQLISGFCFPITIAKVQYHKPNATFSQQNSLVIICLTTCVGNWSADHNE